MGRRRARFRAIVDADETMNPRQKDVLLEALLHSNAEFSYAVHERRYNVSYLCARSDLARFLDMGLFRCCDDGVRHFFIADEGFGDRAWDYLRQRCAAEYARFYREDGTLRDEFHSSCEAAEKFNRYVGFYEPSLMEDIWIEHYAHRRQPIVDEDGLWRRDRSHAGAGPVFGRRPGASKRRCRPVPMRLPRQAAFPLSDASSTVSRRSLSSTRRRQKTRRTPRPRPRRAISTATAFSSSPCRPTR